MRRREWLALPAIFAGLFLAVSVPTIADATVAVPLSRADMVQRSDLVVRAAVTGQISEWNADHSQIVTLTRLHVTTYLKGTGPADITLRQFGGTVDGMTSAVAGDGHVTQGQDVVLFLRRGDGVVFLTAMAQSAYVVQHTPGADPIVRRDLHDLTFANRQGGQMILAEPSIETDETLDHLVREVRAIVGGSR